jgi:hypothetical protein
MSVLKRILGVILGVATGGIAIECFDMLSGFLGHAPANLNPADKEAMADFVSHMPFYCFLIMLAGYVIGAFTGGLIATLITGREALRPAMTVGIILAIAGTYNLFEISHPIWFSIISTLTYIPSAWSGWRVIRKVPSA